MVSTIRSACSWVGGTVLPVVGKGVAIVISKAGGHDLTVGAWKAFREKTKEIENTDKYGRTTKITVPTTWGDSFEGASSKIVKGVTKAAVTSGLVVGTVCKGDEYAGLNLLPQTPVCQNSKKLVEEAYKGAAWAYPKLVNAGKFINEHGGEVLDKVVEQVQNHPKVVVVALPTIVLTAASLYTAKQAYNDFSEAWAPNSLWGKITGYGSGTIKLGLAAVPAAAAIALNMWADTLSVFNQTPTTT